jgi:hypothetical protein
MTRVTSTGVLVHIDGGGFEWRRSEKVKRL